MQNLNTDCRYVQYLKESLKYGLREKHKWGFTAATLIDYAKCEKQ